MLACTADRVSGDDQLLESGMVEFAAKRAFDSDTSTKLVSENKCPDCNRTDCPGRGGNCLERNWDGKFEVGLNGSEGNSRNVNLVFGFDAKREQRRWTTTIDVDYLYSKDEVETTRNRLYSLARWEYDVPDSTGGLFFDNWFELDALEDFGGRIGVHAGWFDYLMKEEDCELKGLIGFGSTKEFEGNDTAWKPEVYLGANWEKKINDRQDLYVRSIFLPDIGDFTSFRLRLKAGWDCDLNEAKTWKVSVSIFDRYDSTPSGTDRKNDIDYWFSLAYSF